MGRITRPPKPAKIKYEHGVGVSWKGEVDEWVWPEAERVAGVMGYRTRPRGWHGTTIYFDSKEKADEFSARLWRYRQDVEQAKERLRPCPVAAGYRRAALGLHAVCWGLSTGIIKDVVRAYRRARSECSSHGMANYAAARVIIARCPHMDHDGLDGHDRARDLAEHMLVYYEARHRAWFWDGLEGRHHLPAFAYHM